METLKLFINITLSIWIGLFGVVCYAAGMVGEFIFSRLKKFGDRIIDFSLKYDDRIING